MLRGQTFNIGTGKSYTILEIAEMVKDATKAHDPAIIFLPARIGETPATLADNSLAKQNLGWEPVVPFEEGIKDLQNYLSQQHASNSRR